ncbi:hypothetical protein BC351_32585 [Paenibacillus ferrarius]|uniref:Uncharacterized protein n=1 Tax=Paenibacillus ferrarius TaxID=1469647 RepID=A0A1V4HEG0_9BACL|nr:hypothetical protein [Paenibacillus ferrarius]OPH52996.1 hypothetical protein BC351_32585 [Paenibacillus ferrarius]
MKLIENAVPIENPFGAEEFVELLGCMGQEEFIDFVTELWDEGEGLSIYHDDVISYVHVASKNILYYRKIDSEGTSKPSESASDSASDSESEPNKNNKSADKARIFTNSLLILILFLSTFLPQSANAASYFQGTMSEDPVNYGNLADTKFNTTTGSVTLPGYLTTVQSKNYTATAYTFTDPRKIPNQASANLSALPSDANESLLTAILAFSQKFDTAQITKLTGITVTDAQVKEATQLALWTYAATVQLKYQIDVNSVSDPTVRSLATAISSWATTQVTNLPANVTMGKHLFPTYKPTLDASAAKMNKSLNYVNFGPYTINSPVATAFNFSVSGGHLLDASGNVVEQIQSGQQFNIGFPET